VGCGGGSSASNIVSGNQTGNGSVNMMVSDASTEDWATIGVKILSIALIPQGGGTNVTAYTAPSPAPIVNLVQLDQLGEIIGNATVPVGTYTGAVVTVSGNPTDIQLISSADPSSALLSLCNATTTVPSSQIQVQGTTRKPCFSPGRNRKLYQCFGFGIRSFPSGIHRRPLAPFGWRNTSVGNKL
jgi:Domain of unknown function (DUF4382)